MEISVKTIKKLRDATGSGILDVKEALENSDGDFEKAVDFLRQKGLAKAAKRSDRDASEGLVELYSHGDGRVGVMVEINCESDFVARSDTFREFAHNVALQIAAAAICRATLWANSLKASDLATKSVSQLISTITPTRPSPWE